MPGGAGFLPSTVIIVHVKYLSTIDMEGLLSCIKYLTNFGGVSLGKLVAQPFPKNI